MTLNTLCIFLLLFLQLPYTYHIYAILLFYVHIIFHLITQLHYQIMPKLQHFSYSFSLLVPFLPGCSLKKSISLLMIMCYDKIVTKLLNIYISQF